MRLLLALLFMPCSAVAQQKAPSGFPDAPGKPTPPIRIAQERTRKV